MKSFKERCKHRKLARQQVINDCNDHHEEVGAQTVVVLHGIFEALVHLAEVIDAKTEKEDKGTKSS